MSTIQELGGFLARESAAAAGTPTPSPAPPTLPAAEVPMAVDQGSNGARRWVTFHGPVGPAGWDRSKS